jgi:molybdopterin molybdotransferase
MATAADGLQGLGKRARVEDAVAWIDAHVAPLGAEDVPLAHAAGRVLFQDVLAEFDLPPFDRAAVDGMAVRADETVGASAYNPLLFRLASGAGGPGDLPAGSAVRLNAGDPLPRGADAVVPLGQVELHEGGACAVIEPVVAGTEVERSGSQGARGSTLVRSGRRLGPGDIGLLASAGRVRVGVVRRPRVRCLSSGAAFEPGTSLPAEAARDANGPMLRALIERDGGVLAEQHDAGSNPETLRATLARPGADILLLVGRNDDAAAALAEAGTLAIDSVALRPGAAAGIGRTTAGVPVLLLPDIPAACLWACEFFAGRAIRRLGGRSPQFPFAPRTMTASRKIVSEIGMTEVVPVRCVNGGAVEPLPSFAAAGLRAITEADGFVVVPEGSEGYQRGTMVTVYLYDEQARAQS